MPDGVGRVGDRATFRAFRHSGCRGRCGDITVVFVPNPAGSRPRVAYAIGRRVGTAVVRNRLRRRLRAVMASLAAEGALPAGAYLVAGGPAAVASSSLDLERTVRRALERATSSARSRR